MRVSDTSVGVGARVLSAIGSCRFIADLIFDRNRRGLARELLRRHQWFHEHSGQNLMGSLTEGDLRRLRSALDQASPWPGPIVEIGCLFGFTTQFIAASKAPGKRLITVDNFSWNPFLMHPDLHREFTRRALCYCVAQGSTSIFDGTSAQWFASYRGPTPSLLFLDGDHSYAAVREELRWALDAGVPIISGHDYSPFHPGVQRAVDELFGPQPACPDSTVWIVKNPSVRG